MGEKKFILFGAGKIGRQALKFLGTDMVWGYCDNIMHGIVNEKPVISFEALVKCQKEYKVILTIDPRTEAGKNVERQLDDAAIDYEQYEEFVIHIKALRYIEQYKEFFQGYRDEIEYMSAHKYSYMLPYAFQEKYFAMEYPLSYDEKYNMYNYIYCGKPLYFPSSYGKGKCIRYLRTLLAEQDEHSPHRYFTETHCVKAGDIFIDAGSAEGLIGLSVIDQVAKLYIIECDSEWLEALAVTFKPYKDKVVVVKKYVSDINFNGNITIDSFIHGDNQSIFIKVDIEGYEDRFLLGAQQTLIQNDVRLSLCTYHKRSDAKMFATYLEQLNYNVEFSEGYIFRWWYDFSFEKGVLMAHKR